MYEDLKGEVARQDVIHPAGYPATRDGVRLGIASAQDGLDEALEGWRIDRVALEYASRFSPARTNLRTELLQTAAVIMRVVRSLDGE